MAAICGKCGGKNDRAPQRRCKVCHKADQKAARSKHAKEFKRLKAFEAKVLKERSA